MESIFCTFFDSNYLTKGVTLIRSLSERPEIPATVYVMACDRKVERVVSSIQISSCVKVVKLEDLEAAEPKLIRAKQSRTPQEYFWTIGAQFAKYVMERFGPPSLTYIDADMMLFQDPRLAMEAIGDKSIAITPHNFPVTKRDYEVNGKYCVSWVSWKNDEAGRKCLSTWAGQCLDWCYYRHENGKFGDQKYLDSWADQYPGKVFVANDLPLWPAPWNIWAHEVGPGPTVDGKGVIAYHFHEFRQTTKWNEGGFRYTGWPIREDDVDHIYLPYVSEYLKSERIIKHVESLSVQGK